ncbi:MAG: tRNA adenosine(34) deaminase TadA [Acidimicrobiales bacterium]
MSGPDEAFMRLALGLAALAGEKGDVPIGALVVRGGEIVGQGANAREASGDPTAHAEVVALRQACASLGSWRLDGATVYATLEPCAMCAGAIVAARIERLVFAAADPKAGCCGSLYNFCADPRLPHEVAVSRGVLGREAAEALASWFAARRRQLPRARVKTPKALGSASGPAS